MLMGSIFCFKGRQKQKITLLIHYVGHQQQHHSTLHITGNHKLPKKNTQVNAVDNSDHLFFLCLTLALVSTLTLSHCICLFHFGQNMDNCLIYSLLRNVKDTPKRPCSTPVSVLEVCTLKLLNGHLFSL